VFQDISAQLVELKERCRELKEENEREKWKRAELKERMLVKELELGEVRGELKEKREELEQNSGYL
jgi:chromosome segregation ATPase